MKKLKQLNTFQQKGTKSELLKTISHKLDRLMLILRIVFLFHIFVLFAMLGSVDAVLCLLWPAWCARDDAPRWYSRSLVHWVFKAFPLLLLVPYGWRPQYRVLRCNYPRRLRPTERGQVELSIQNVGGMTWGTGTAQSCLIGVISPLGESAFYIESEWLAPARPADLPSDAEVPPASTIDLHVPIRAPSTSGHYEEKWGLLIEGSHWLSTLRGIELQIEVNQEA